MDPPARVHWRDPARLRWIRQIQNVCGMSRETRLRTARVRFAEARRGKLVSVLASDSWILGRECRGKLVPVRPLPCILEIKLGRECRGKLVPARPLPGLLEIRLGRECRGKLVPERPWPCLFGEVG